MFWVVSWPPIRSSINASKDSILLLIGGKISPLVALFDVSGWFILSKLHPFFYFAGKNIRCKELLLYDSHWCDGSSKFSFSFSRQSFFEVKISELANPKLYLPSSNSSKIYSLSHSKDFCKSSNFLSERSSSFSTKMSAWPTVLRLSFWLKCQHGLLSFVSLFH